MTELSLLSKIALIVIFLSVIMFVVYLIIKNRMKIEFGLLWILAFSGASFIVLSYDTLNFLTKLIGGIYPTGTLTVLAIGFIFLVLIIFTAYLTNMSDKIKSMSQYISFLENRLRSQEDKERNV